MPLSGQTQNQSGSSAHRSTYQQSPKLMLYHLHKPPLRPASLIPCPPSSNLHPLSLITWLISGLKNTICVLERTSPSYSGFTIYGYNFSMNTKKRLHGPHIRSESYSRVPPRFQFAKYGADWLEFHSKHYPSHFLLDNLMTSWYRSIRDVCFFAW